MYIEYRVSQKKKEECAEVFIFELFFLPPGNRNIGCQLFEIDQ